MQLVSRKNFILFLAAVLVVALGIMAISLLPIKKVKLPKLSSTPQYELEVRKLQTQSQSDQVNDIDKDLMETDLSTLDKELPDIENELNQAY